MQEASQLLACEVLHGNKPSQPDSTTRVNQPAATSPPPTARLKLDRQRILPWLWLTTGVLVGMSVAVNALSDLTGRPTIFGLVPLFDVDNEQSVPTFFSACLLLGAGMLLVMITTVKRDRHEPFSAHWFTLAMGFGLMAMDEVAGFHEKLGTLVNVFIGSALGPLRYCWAVAGLTGVLLLAIPFVPFLRQLPRRTAAVFLLAGGIYLGGAIGIESLWTLHAGISGLDYPYWIYTAVEEGMEMVGVVIFIGALLRYFAAVDEVVGITAYDGLAAPAPAPVPCATLPAPSAANLAAPTATRAETAALIARKSQATV